MNPVSILAAAVLSVIYVWMLYNIPILAVGVCHLRRSNRKEKAPLLSWERLPKVSIIAPVRDEDKVVGRLLDSLLKLNYPHDMMEIIVVEDGSRDNTLEICRQYAGRCSNRIKLLHKPGSNGKPPALNYALQHAAGEIIGVFDADSVPEADALLKAAEHFEDASIAAVQGRTSSINADENMLAKFVAYEEAAHFEAYIRGKDALGLFVPLTGSCYMIRRAVLEKIGGWDEEALCEDMELAARLTDKGFRIKYAENVKAWQETPSSLRRFFKQRTRWLRGTMEVGLKYGKLVKNMDKKCLDAEATLAGPFIFIPCLLGYAVTLFSFLIPFRHETMFLILANATSLFTLILLSIAGIALTYAAKPRKASNLLWLPFIYGYWLIQNFVALYALMQIVLRRPKSWVKTAKTGAITKTLNFDC